MKKLLLLSAALVAALGATAQNPYLPLWEHVPDGEPRVFEDPDHPGRLRAYIVGSHDTHLSEYCGNDVHMWSAPVEDLTQWRDEGPIFSYYVDGRWDTMYAPDLVEVTDKQTGKKTYWLYPHSRGWRRTPMVCRGDRPDGPFAPVNLTEDGRACVEGSLIDFDPSVFVEPVTSKKDPDFQRGFRAYVYYGFMHSSAYELDPDNMFAVRPGTKVHDPFLPAGNRQGEVGEPTTTVYPDLFPGENPEDYKFFEASSIRQVGNKYVTVYSGFSGSEYGLSNSNSTLRYAYADTPLGPWRSGGVVVDSRGIVPNEDGTHLTTSNAGHNTHGSLQQINGQWYVFYHRPPRGFGYARQAMVAPIRIDWDKKPVSKGGGVRISGYDPYMADNRWTARATDGTEYRGGEVTSEGFQIFGLPPYQYYSAGIACYMTGPGSNDWLQDNHDVWQNHMDLAGIRNGGVVGFKYFGFGGLAESQKGVPAFEGTREGDDTHINLHLTPSGRGAFRIHVMLDGPYANSTWQGREIAVLDVPADAPREPRVHSISAHGVEGLTGKHAIYLVVEGPEIEESQTDRPQWGRPQQPQRPQGLFDLHGIGFSKKSDSSFGLPLPAPKVTIAVDGKPLNIPEQPIFSNNTNGYTECNHYQVYAPLKASSTIQATADFPRQGSANNFVTFEISPITDGRATVRATFQNKQKIFLIN